METRLDPPEVAASDRPLPYISTIPSGDALRLSLYRWPARGEKRATIALLHGLAEHARRYHGVAERLNERGIEVVAIDLRGHGATPGKRVSVERFDDYLLDARALLGAVAGDSVPVFLMGHSMGGAIAALYAVEQAESGADDSVAGLILSSPALAPGRDVPRWMLSMSQIISRLWPNFPAMKIDPKLLSRDREVVEANRDDRLVHHAGIPARTGAELLLAMTRIERGRAALKVPLLVFHGTRDKLTEPQGSRDFEANAGSPDKTLTLYEGSFHETMNDLDRDKVIDDLAGWVLAHA